VVGRPSFYFIKMKQCTKCKTFLDLSCYSKDIQKKDGLRPSCKKCNIRAKPKEVLEKGYKRCSKCKLVLLENLFDKDKIKPDGLYSSCKECRYVLYKKERKKRPIKKDYFKPRRPPKVPIGTRYVTKQGYVWLTGLNNREHRIVMERFLGRKLKSSEYVHHKDGNKTNNDISNLEIISASDHAKHHYPEIKEKFLFREDMQKNCLVCNKQYTSKSYLSKYCSGKCQRITRKEYLKQWIAKNRLKE
jgi:hypothetical protein